MTSSDSKTATDGADGAVAFLGLGANLGERAGTLRAAIDLLSRCIAIDAISDVYETEPFGYTDQPRFLNLVVRGRAGLDPRGMLGAIKQVERELGRTRTLPMGPRVIDIDLLLYGGIAIDDDDLTVPHAGLLERAFVLRPLLDIDPELRHPVTGDPLSEALRNVQADAATMRRLGALDDIAAGDDATR